ncbi:death ligand signal enhancer-like isoform X1 [Pomacea canaliculata]|uniref:death ligand signal enhancer-like isoform X1 n=1 Tax=Pomacea canaliculata TaxID=400727 RepID=UPI000D73A964|nr:death ligand signal enhancer-like isoform X1 [Pomacea canaliculata]
MWRIWNSFPRVFRQQLHGPRASAGVYVEEEKAESDIEKYAEIHKSCVITCPSQHVFRKLAQCFQKSQEVDPQKEAGERARADHDQQDWWQHYADSFWFRLFSRYRTFEAVTWGTAAILGLQLSRKPNLKQYIDLFGDRDQRQQCRGLLLRMAFAMAPDCGSLTATKAIVQQHDEQPTNASYVREKTENVSTHQNKPFEEQSLDDIMQEFQGMCQEYAAVGSSISGIYAADQGNMTSAIEHLKLASSLGHAPAYFNLGLCFEMGCGVSKDMEKAAECYRMAAEAGHTQSVFNLALMTLKGEGGMEEDRQKGVQLLTQAAQQGLAQAQTYLGVYYTEDDDDQQDFTKAVSYFKAAADQNDAEGQYLLGICYENGWGTENDEAAAGKMYSAAAKSGHDGALYNLAAFHEYGLGGLMQDMDLATELYQRAAAEGNASAQQRLQQINSQTTLSQKTPAEELKTERALTTQIIFTPVQF